MQEPYTLELRILGENLPGRTFGEHTDVRAGIQKGEEVEQDVPGDAEGAVFTVTLTVKRNKVDGRPMFSGLCVFGPSKDPFLYLSWGEVIDGKWEMFRRAKLRLSGLGWDTIMKAVDTGQTVELAVNLTDGRGHPNCGGLDERSMRWVK